MVTKSKPDIFQNPPPALAACGAEAGVQIEAICRQMFPEGYGAAFIALNDNAPECTAYLAWQQYSIPATRVLAAQAKEFYRHCYTYLRLHDVTIVDRRAQRLSEEWDEQPEKFCLWPDACLGALMGSRALVDALTSAIGLRNRLRRYNETLKKNWWEHLHARILVGTTFTAALRCIGCAWRGETTMPGDEADLLPRDLVPLFLAAGLRFGPDTAERAEVPAVGA